MTINLLESIGNCVVSYEHAVIAVGDDIDVTVLPTFDAGGVDLHGNVFDDGEVGWIDHRNGVAIVRGAETAGVSDVQFAVADADAIGVRTRVYGGVHF